MDAAGFGSTIGAMAGPGRAPSARAAAASPRVAQCYVAGVIAAGGATLVACFPRTTPNLTLFLLFLVASSTAAAFKVTLPIGRGSSTMSVSYAADFTALLLLGPNVTMLISMVSGWAQCAVNARQKNPPSRTIFSMAELVLTVQASGLAYRLLGGQFGAFQTASFAGPLVGAAVTYFVVNTGLVAGAMALSGEQSILSLWRENFLWAAPSYFVGAGTAAVVASLIHHTGEWFALLAAAPVYLTYRTYRTYLGRMEDEQRHVRQISELHWATMEALELAKQSERALAAEKEQLAITLRSIGDGVITTDTLGQVRTLNPTAERLTGWTQADAAGLPLRDVFQPAADGAAACDQVASRTTDGARIRLPLLCRDGSSRIIEQVTSPLHDSAGEEVGAVLVFRDVTDAIALDQERLRASKMESLAVLAGGIAHDFNNILLAISGHVSLAALEAANEPLARRLADAERACIRARGLTQQLLTFAKGGAPVRKRVGLAPLVRDWARFALHGSNVRCEESLAADLWPVNADEGQLSQVVNNIVLNAKQAMPEGGTVTIRASNLVIGPHNRPAGFNAPDGRYVALAIGDNGPGIPEQNQRRVFDPYFTTKPDGTGLGLASSYSIVSKHEGHLGLESEIGQGTTFTVYLPAMTPAAEAAPLAPATGIARGCGRVLVMDDEDAVRTVAADMLEFLGYDVVTAAHGQEAVERYRTALAAGRRFDAVMLDLTVPGGMGGQETLAALRALDPPVRAVAASGYSDDEVMARFQEFGFRAVIAKPFTVTELGRLFAGLTARVSAPDEAAATAGVREPARDRTLVTAAPGGPAPVPTGQASSASPASLSTVERAHILQVLEKLQGNKVAAAQALGVSRRTLYRRLQKYNLRPTPPSTSAPPSRRTGTAVGHR
ncbi:MAG: response regulator [Acidobacteriota bacterium]|nr:response regulator [Acidobacteriota bacterium]